jgi:exonuclease VII large subunit
LERGFSVAFRHPDGQILRSVEGLKAGDRLKTKLFKGSLISRVEEVEAAEEKGSM